MATIFYNIPLESVNEMEGIPPVTHGHAATPNSTRPPTRNGRPLSVNAPTFAPNAPGFTPSPSQAHFERNVPELPRRSTMPLPLMPPSFPSFRINLASHYSSATIQRIEPRIKTSSPYRVYSGLKQLHQPHSKPLDEFQKRGGVRLFDPSHESNYANGHGLIRNWLDSTGLYQVLVSLRPPHQRLTIWRVPSSFTPSQIFLQPAFGRSAFVPEVEEDGVLGEMAATDNDGKPKIIEVHRTNDTIQGYKGLELRFNPAILEVPRPKLPNRDLMVRIWLSRIVPEDVYTQEFRSLAGMLANIRVRLDIWVEETLAGSGATRRKKVAFPRPFQSSCHVSALTSIALIMRAFGDIEAFIFILSLAPVVIATDLRLYRMGQAVGTAVTRAALSCIFSEMASMDFMPDQIHLMSTATDLLVCHLGRHDHPRIISHGQSEVVTFKLIRLINIKPIQGLDDPVFYSRMAAIRDGVIYGAMRCYAQDVDRHTEQSLTSLQAMLNATVSLSSTAGFLVAPPFGGLIQPISAGKLPQAI